MGCASPGAAAATCSPRGSAGAAGRSVLQDAPPASPHAAHLLSAVSCRRELEACGEQGRLWAAAAGAAAGLHRAGLSQVARTVPSPWLCPAAASWPQAPAAGGKGLPWALH